MLRSAREPVGAAARALAVAAGRTVAARLAAVPRQPGVLLRALRRAVELALRGWLRSFHRLRIVGRENLPERGPFVIVANHASHLDVLCLLAAVPLADLNRTYPTASADYFFASLPRAALAALVFNGVPFHRPGRGDEHGVRASLDCCRRLLTGAESGGDGIVVLFPEGSRSPDGAGRPFKRGVGVLVAGTGVPVVPCRLDGTFESMPKGRWLPRPRRIVLTIGRPRVYAALGTGKAAAQAIAEDLYAAVAGMARPATGADPLDEDEPAVHLAA